MNFFGDDDDDDQPAAQYRETRRSPSREVSLPPIPGSPDEGFTFPAHAFDATDESMDLGEGTSSGYGAAAPRVNNAGAGGGAGGAVDRALMGFMGTDWEDEDGEESRVVKLMRVWMNERCAPELLPYQGEVVRQIEKYLIEQKQRAHLAQQDQSGREELHISLMIVNTQNMRVGWILKEYLRTRLHKIEQFVQYTLMDQEMRNSMSTNELQFAQQYETAWRTLMDKEVTSNLAEKHRKLDEPHMLPRPDLNKSVFVQVLKGPIGPILLPQGDQLTMQRGERHFLRYTTVRELVRNTDYVELV